MIARVLIQTPFTLWKFAKQDLQPVQYAHKGVAFRIHAPVRGELKFSPAMEPGVWKRLVASIDISGDQSATTGVQVGGHELVECDLLKIDCHRDNFNRRFVPSEKNSQSIDPAPESIFHVANQFVATCQLLTRSSSIAPLLHDRIPWSISYLTDSEESVAPEDGYVRGWVSSSLLLSGAVLSPAHWTAIGSTIATADVPAWEVLLLRAPSYLPDIGPAILSAASALEAFIPSALDELAKTAKIPPALWEWIKRRDGKYHQLPSFADKFDILLEATGGKSMKTARTDLWQDFQNIKSIRNNIAHGNRIELGGKLVTEDEARRLISRTSEIIVWIEQFLPESRRRMTAPSSDLGMVIGSIAPVW